MTLGELRNAGAEAIELNGIRLSTRSSFTGQAGSIAVDGVPISSPYTWKVIGEPQTIATALDIQAGSAAQMRAKGANVAITRRRTSRSSRLRLRVRPSSPPTSELPPYMWGVTVPALVGW